MKLEIVINLITFYSQSGKNHPHYEAISVCLSVFSPPSFFLSSSGLSFEESKELTKADLNLESVRAQSPSHQTVPAAHAPEDPKGTEDSSQPAVAAAAAVAAKNIKPTQEHLKPPPAQKEPVFTPEPMKTRRSQYAEERRLSTVAQPAPAAAAETPAAEKRTEQATVGTLPEKERQKEEKTELPQSPVKSHPPKATVESKEEPASAMKPAQERKSQVVSEPSVPSEPQKRKSVGETEGEITPEKRPRMSSVSSESSVSSVSPAASSTSSPPTPTLATNQRVPPLKVGKSFSEHRVSLDVMHPEYQRPATWWLERGLFTFYSKKSPPLLLFRSQFLEFSPLLCHQAKRLPELPSRPL